MKTVTIPILVKRSSLVFDKLANQLLMPYDLTSSQFKILMMLYHAPDSSVRQIDLESKFDMTNPTVTGLVQKLEAKDLVKRTPHPQDKRSKVLTLTKRALDLQDELHELSDTMDRQMTQKLNEEERIQLAALLTKML